MVSISGASEYNGAPLLEQGKQYTLDIGYGVMEEASTTVVPLPEGITLPLGPVAVPSGNKAIAGLEMTAEGLSVTFASEWPEGVLQGMFGVTFTADLPTQNSSIENVSWGSEVDGPGKLVFKKTGDDFKTVTTSESKWIESNSLLNYVTVANGVVAISPNALNATVNYVVSGSTTTANSAYTVQDTLDAGLEFVAGSAAAQITSWDENGMNKIVETATAPAVSGDTFTHTFDMPANSELKLTYKVKIKDAAALETFRANLQAKYDAAVAAKNYGTVSEQFGNTAIINGSTRNADARFEAKVTEPAGEAGVNTGSVIVKKNNLKTINEIVTDDNGNLETPLPIDYSIAIDLRQWDGTNAKKTLSRDVIVTDPLREGLEWDVNNDFLAVTSSGSAVALTKVDYSAKDSAGQFSYAVSDNGRELWINLGQDNKQYSIVATALLKNVSKLTKQSNTSAPDSQQYEVWNRAFVNVNDSYTNLYSTNTGSVIDRGDTSEGVTDTRIFSKTGPTGEVEVSKGQSTTIPFKFLLAAGTGDVTKVTITDFADHNIFDVTEENLQDIKDSITFTYDWSSWIVTQPSSADMWDVKLIDGNLEFSLNSNFVAAINGGDTTKRLELTVELPTMPLLAKETITFNNKAKVSGENSIQNSYVSTATGQMTAFGDELEVTKKVYSAATDSYTSNLRVELDQSGQPATDEFIYRVQMTPHGSFTNMVLDVTDVLPQGVEFVGFVKPENVAAGTVESGNEYTISGSSLKATYTDGGTPTVTVAKGKLTKGKSETLYFKVRLTDTVTPNVGIVNKIGKSEATIVPSNGYPLSIQKRDAEDSEKVITDLTAIFQVADAEGNIVANNVHVVNGKLVADGSTLEQQQAVIVKNTGTYTVTETKAPAGYALTDQTYTVTVGEYGLQTADVVIYNTPADEPTDPTDPTTEPTDPTDPTTEPTDPTDPTDPSSSDDSSSDSTDQPSDSVDESGTPADSETGSDQQAELSQTGFGLGGYLVGAFALMAIGGLTVLGSRKRQN